MCVYTYINNLNEVMHPLPRRHRQLFTKTSVSEMGNFLLSFWTEKPKQLPKQYRLLPLVALVKILLKTPHNSNTGLRGIDPDLTEKTLL